MDGHFQTKTNKIEQWLEKSIQNKSFFEYDDLHIDQIDSTYGNREKWIEGGILCLKAATDLLLQKKIDMHILLALPLRSDVQYLGVNFYNTVQLKEELDEYTPPSLYIFSSEQWSKIITDTISIDQLNFNIAAIKCFYLEYRENDEEEYRRTLWLDLQS